MNTKAPPNPELDAMLTELASLGMRAVRVVTRLMEIEQAAADVVAADLPEPGLQPRSAAEALQAGRDVDAVTDLVARAVPRAEGLARAHERISRSVRRSVALIRRMQAGWTGAGAADTRQAMLQRQVARGVADAIHRESSGEAAERLFDELAELLDDPGTLAEIGVLPEAEVTRRICRDLGLAGSPIRHLGNPQPPAPEGGWPVDTG